MINEAVIGAEIMLALDGVMSNYSLNSSSSTKCLFKEMFKDSKIVRSFLHVVQNAHTWLTLT